MDSKQWDARYRAADSVWSAEPNRFLVEEISGLKPGKALDLACGEGRNAIWLAKEGWRVRATDFSPVAIEKARARAKELGLEIEFAVEDAAARQSSRYDLVILFYLQLRNEILLDVMREAASALSPGGTLLVVAHDSRNLEEGTGGPQDPAVLYGPEAVLPALEGLVIERAETVERPVEKDGETLMALDCLVRARAPD